MIHYEISDSLILSRNESGILKQNQLMLLT